MSDVVLISGGLGYVGGRIVQKLAENGNYALRIGTRRPSSERPKWLENGNLVQMDLMSGENLDVACKEVRCVIHLAALNEIESLADPEKALLVNSLGTLKLIRAAERAEVERFIYFSTAHIYGSPLLGQITEETLPRPIHPYAITHKVAEDFILSSNDQKRLRGIVLRLSNSLGAPVSAEINRWMLVGNDLCRQAVTERKLVLKTSGMQRRDFIALSDVANAVLHFLDLPDSKCGNGIFNLGGENSLRIIDLAQNIAARCKAVLDFTPPIVRPELTSIEVSENLDYRIDKLRNTGFCLKSNFDEEIDATLRLCQKAFSRKS